MSRIRIATVSFGTAFAAVMLAAPIMAAQSLYDTNRVMEHHGDECARVPACQSVESPRMLIGIDQIKVFAVHCPSSHPFVWHWDTEQHEHIYVKLVGRTKIGLTLSASNRADASGNAQIFIGCSPEPFAFSGTGFMQSTTGLPTGHLKKRNNKGSEK